MTKICSDSQCRRKGKRLRFTQFPRNRRMKDGINLICKECARRRVTESRNRVRAMKAAQPQRKPNVLAERDPLAEVYEAIKNRNYTRERIQKVTRLSYDEIGEALVQLVWDFRAVRIQQGEFLLVNSRVCVAVAA